MSVIILNSNGGFGAANNLASAYASSDRLIIMNPDVFPNDARWIEKHSALAAALPAAQTALFGAPLYYDDGSLMHGGMYFDLDTMPNFSKSRRFETSLLRVEHYGKGAPPDSAQFIKARPVPAVTGAFMSLDRSWFETLGGFTPDYVFGHYEDADLCLKSISAGRMPWLHDLRLWHLEGKGSVRKPQHEGGSIVNRWLFTKTWGDFVAADLLGPAPAYAGLAV
jgi:GT2 family glycosyltransferase